MGILSSEITWVKAHEKLIIVAISAFVLLRVGQGIENIILKRDANAASLAAAAVQRDSTANKVLSDQIAQLKATTDAQAAQLNASISASKTALVARQKEDSVSTPEQIGNRWGELLKLKPGSVKTTATETSITNDTANQTVQALEQVPVLLSEVSDLTVEMNAQTVEIDKQNELITGLNKQIADDVVKDTDDVKLAKAQGRKSFWKGFKIGLVVGAVGVEAIRVWAGHP